MVAEIIGGVDDADGLLRGLDTLNAGESRRGVPKRFLIADQMEIAAGTKESQLTAVVSALCSSLLQVLLHLPLPPSGYVIR